MVGVSALTEALAAARKELDEHKEKHGGHYLLGCEECWRRLSAWADLDEKADKEAKRARV